MRYITLILILGLGNVIGCDSSTEVRSSDTEAAYSPSPVVLLDQNWTDHDRQLAWYTSFGSQVLPVDWFRVIEVADSQVRLSEPQVLESFGFVTFGASTQNPDGFPIGLTVSGEKDGYRWVGLGCSGCHSAPIYYDNQVIHVDGGGAMIEFHRFESAVINGLNATLKDSEKFDRFKLALGHRNGKQLRTAMTNWTQRLEHRRDINQTDSEYGYGRLDAFGQIFNAVATEALAIPENRLEPDAPVSYPVLWDASHLDVVQWNGSAPNTGPAPLIQNTTTAIAVFGHVNVNPKKGSLGYPSSVEVGNMAKIQNTWYKLTAPKWPEEIFGQLDPDLISKGAVIYSRECQSCHVLVDSSNPDRKLYAHMVSANEVGTDPTMVNNFSDPLVKSGVFEGEKLLFAAGPEIKVEEHPITLVAHAAAGALLHDPVAAAVQGLESLHSVYSTDANQNAKAYKARPLNGVWSSAPYLHNGSVPTLVDMLKLPAERSSFFKVGRVEFDTEVVGLSGRVINPEQVTDFDTGLPGNSNAGHVYGAHLNGSEKRALLEYLKYL